MSRRSGYRFADKDMRQRITWMAAKREARSSDSASRLFLRVSFDSQPRNGGGVVAPEALRHCAMLSAITFIDAAAVWLTVA
jgi:hypothetical protein